jgi:hypothetical protein
MYMVEKVYFLFIQKNKVLLEYLKTESGKFDFLTIPSGQVKEYDKKHLLIDSIEHALLREIYKKFSGTVIPLQYELATEQHNSTDNVSAHVFFIYSWDGDHPSYIFENKEKTAKLRWFTVDDAIASVQEDTDRNILRLAKAMIRVKSILQRRYHL